MKSGYKEIGFGKQTIAKVFEEWYTVPSYQRHYVWESIQFHLIKDTMSGKVTMSMICWKIFLQTI